MIWGRVTEALDPVVELGLKQGDAITAIPAVIDTGFSGMVCLAERYLEQIALTFRFIERYELANGDVVAQDVFEGHIVFDGQEQEVELIVTTSHDTLIGAALLKNYTLTIDYPGQQVRLTRNRRRTRRIA